MFDRGASELEVSLLLFSSQLVRAMLTLGTQALDAYIHPPAPFLISKLSDTQLESFIDSALAEQPSSLPLPFGTEKYAPRINPDESMRLHIFRNRYERKPPIRRRPGCGRRIRLEDQPYMMDFLEKLRNKEKEETEVEDDRSRQ